MNEPSESGEEILAGGGVNHVVRVGATVRRPVGAWTPAVHALLDHLAAVGFTGAPRAHGIDADGREILDYLLGEVGHYPVPEHLRTDQALRAVAQLLRDFHDATVGFVPPVDATWYLPAREPAEVVCHGDVAPYNCVFRRGRAVALIDFDTAHPGPRVWDVAYAAYRFVPLTDSRRDQDALPVAEQARRLRLFADAYRLGDADRQVLVTTAWIRLEHLVRHMRDQAVAGHAAFARHLADGHDALYRADAAHLTRHHVRLRQEITG